jgi:hypothetical protein
MQEPRSIVRRGVQHTSSADAGFIGLAGLLELVPEKAKKTDMK